MAIVVWCVFFVVWPDGGSSRGRALPRAVDVDDTETPRVSLVVLFSPPAAHIPCCHSCCHLAAFSIRLVISSR